MATESTRPSKDPKKTELFETLREVSRMTVAMYDQKFRDRESGEM
jgi:hypothetical protein